MLMLLKRVGIPARPRLKCLYMRTEVYRITHGIIMYQPLSTIFSSEV